MAELHLDPSYINASKGPTTNTICVFFMIMSFIVISLRLFSRLWVVRAMGLDDSKFQCFSRVIAAYDLLTGCLHAVLISFAVVGSKRTTILTT